MYKDEVVSFSMFHKSSAVAEMGDRMATIDMGLKLAVLCPFRRTWVPI